MISQFQEQYERRHQIAREWKERGGKVLGYFYSYVPEELIYAAGILPVQITEGEEGHEQAEEYLHDFVCDYVQSSLAQALAGTYSYLDGLVVPFACDPLRYLYGLWRRHVKMPFFFLLSTLKEATPEAKTYYLQEWRELQEGLEALSGAKITDHSLAHSIQVYDENRALLHRLYQMRAPDPPFISGSEMCQVVKAGLVMPKEEHNRMLRRLLSQVSHRTPRDASEVRVMLTGPIFEEYTSKEVDALKIVEESGGVVVADDFSTGLRYFWQPIEVRKGALLESLVERYLGKVPGPFRYPSELRAAQLLEQAIQYKVKGAIFLLPKYCDPYSFEQPLIEEKLAEKGLPTLTVETTSPIAAGPLRTRLQAFIESLA